MVLTEARDLFLNDRETYCSDKTVKNYQNNLRYFFDFVSDRLQKDVSEISLEEIERLDINQYSIYLKNKIRNDNNPNFKAKEPRKISARTRKDYLKDMKCFWMLCIENGYCQVNPSEHLKLPKAYGRIVEPLTVDEVNIIDSCYSINSTFGCRNLAMIHCLLDAGMRPGEVVRLKIQDLYFSESYFVIHFSKGGKSRIVPMGRTVKKYLQYWLEKRPDCSHEYVFCVENGDPLTGNALKCVIDRLKISSEITRLFPYLLRHTFGTSFCLGGGNLEILRLYMGHSSIETTQGYLHLADNLRFCNNIYHLDPIFFVKAY